MKYLSYLFFYCLSVSFIFGQSKPLDLSNAVLQLTEYQKKIAKGQANGYAPLDANILVPPQFIFPGFDSAPVGSIWSKSDTGSFQALSNVLSFYDGGASVNNVRIGALGEGRYGISIVPGQSIPLVLGAGFSNGKIYIQNGNEIGSSNPGYTDFLWSIKSSGEFKLGTGSFSGDINLNSKNIIEVNEIKPSSPLPGQTQTGVRFKLSTATPEIYSLGSDQTLWFRGANFNLGVNDVSDIDTNYQIKKSYVLNVSTADNRYAKRSTTNSWPETQSFSQISLITPLSLQYGGLGVDLSTDTGKATARQNLGIGQLQPFNTRLQQISNMTPPVNSFIVGTTGSGLAQKTKDETVQILGLVPGQNVQAFSSLLQSISNSSNETESGTKYFYVLNGGVTPSISRRSSTDARSDLGFSILASSIMTASSATSMQALLQLLPGTHVQPFNSLLTQISTNNWGGSTSITTLGNISQGTWDSTPISPIRGGTGLAQSPAQGQILVGTSNGGYELSRSISLQSLTLTSSSGSVPSITTNSTAKIVNLNADMVDGIDLNSQLNKNVTFTDGESKTHTIVIEKGLIKSWNITP
jgi:hypothetical protein